MAGKQKTKQKQQTQQSISGAEILVQALVNHGVEAIFAYPGGASMPLHQALRKHRDSIRTILPRHEQGGAFAAQGVARATGKTGVCMATSGPGATNLVTALADAKLDSVPMVAITGQVPQAVIGSDAFQETPMVEVCRAITKHHYMITDINDVARIVKEAFHIANTGRPGPVLIDFPKDVQLTNHIGEVDYDPEMNLPGYIIKKPKVAPEQIAQVLAALKRSKKPILYVGGGIVNGNASEELREFAYRTGVPVTTTVMGIGVFPEDHEQSLHMLGMHGTVYANYAVRDADLLLAIGVRFDDRVTGKLEEFAKHGKIVHVDLDASEMHKNKEAHIPIIADAKDVLKELNATITDDDIPDISEWTAKVQKWKKDFPLSFEDAGDKIQQQYAIRELCNQTKDNKDFYMTTGVGQHQMWAAQFYLFGEPRHWLSSAGLGTMGFGLPAAMGVQTALPDALVVNIDGDGSIQMNIQELATLYCEGLPVKTLLLNNQHLGMVMQWEDRFLDGKRAHTYLGPVDHDEALGDGDGTQKLVTYPNFVQIAEGYGVKAKQVRSKAEFPAALAEMLAYDGPYLLDVICEYQEHVLPMIPSGGTADDIIVE